MISALAITGVTLVAVFAASVLALFISMTVAGTGYVGRHRAPPARKRRRTAKRKRGPSGPRSHHRTLGGSRPRPPRERQAPIRL
ncbi:MAG TPA: hypothetical protein VIL71_13270 [Spirillospora sp.]